MPGPTRRPSNLKVISGTARPDRHVEPGAALPLVADAPPAPDWMPNAHAVREWDRLAPMLVANKLLAEADLGALGHLCALHGKIVQLWTAGETPTGHLLAQFNTLAQAFGLSPAWRSKVKPIADEKAGNRFTKFRAPGNGPG
jgi:phage terminase small subunit